MMKTSPVLIRELLEGLIRATREGRLQWERVDDRLPMRHALIGTCNVIVRPGSSVYLETPHGSCALGPTADCIELGRELTELVCSDSPERKILEAGLEALAGAMA